MNATLTQPSTAELVHLPLSAIRPSATNPRRHFDAAELEDLTRCMKQSGLLQRVLVRKLLNTDSDPETASHVYELVIGARRLAAAAVLQWGSIPVECREMSDAEVREAQIIENLQRANVHPLEEAEAFQELLLALGSIPAVAAKLGKEQSYVAKCLRLMALTVWSRDALRGGLITIEHALLLARLAEAEQNAALKWCLDRNAGSKTRVDQVVEQRLARRKQEETDRAEGKLFPRYIWEPESVVALKSHLETQSGVLLSRAPWAIDQEDNLLPGVGACSECPKNTKANTPLFGDLDMGEAKCTDGAQFAAKTEAFVQIAMRKAGHDEQAKVKVLVPRLSWKYSGVKPALLDVPGMPLTANPAKVLKKGQWLEAKPGSCPNVRPGITMDWSDAGDRGYMGGKEKLRKPGELLQVCIAVGCKVHPKDWEKPKSKSHQPERLDPEAQKRAREEEAEVAKVERQIRSQILHAMLLNLDEDKAVRLVADKYSGIETWRKKLHDELPHLKGPQLEAYALFCASFARELQPNGYWMTQNADGVKGDREAVWKLAKQCGVDATKIAAQYFHDSYTDAGSLETLGKGTARLYPKGVPWPGEKKAAAKKTPAKKVTAAKKMSPKAAAKKTAAKKGAKR